MENQTPIKPVNQVEPQPKQSNFLVILLSTLLFISVLIAGFFAYQTQRLVAELRIKNEELIIKNLTPIATVEPVANTNPTADWKTYTNEKYGFAFKYPSYLLHKSNIVDSVTDKNLVSETFTSEDYKFTQQAGLDNINITSGLLMTLNINKNGCQNNNLDSLSKNLMVSELGQSKINQTSFILFHYDWGGQGSENVVFKVNEFCPSIAITYGQNYYDSWKQIRDQILSTFKFTGSDLSIPKPISSLFDSININFKLNLVPVEESQFYSPTGLINKKSWKLDLINANLGKSFATFINTQLTPNYNESGGVGGGGIDAYENSSIKCFHTYGYRGGDPTNWKDPFDYLSCAEK